MERFKAQQRPEDTPAEAPVTAREEAAEPGGEERAENEAARERDTERSAGLEAAARPGAPAEAAPPSEGERAAEAEDPLARAERERDQYLALAQRAQADFENYRKRAAREAAAAGQRAKSGLVRELLPVVDNLERALDSAGDSGGPLADGVRLVLSELQGVLARQGVVALAPV